MHNRNKTMKRSLVISLLAVFMLICSCHHGHCADLRVLATTFPIWQFTQNVCNNVPGVKVDLLVPAAAGCPHDFALKPADLQKLAQADVIVINGAGLEEFLAKPLAALKQKPLIINASQNVPVLAANDQGHEEVNPHTFASPENAAIMATNIAAGIAGKDIASAPLYNQNATQYVDRLRKLSAALKEIGNKAKNRRIALEHDALAYLALNADLEIIAIFENTASAGELARLRQNLTAKKPALLAGDAQYPDRLLKMLAQETDLPFVKLNPCASGPADAPLDYYEKVMANNIEILETDLVKK